MRLDMNLNSIQTITPQMITTMTTLQMSTQELEDYLQELSCENPMVELEEPKQEAAGDAFAEKLRWLRSCDRQNRSYYPEDEARYQIADPSQEDSLERCLLEQLLPMRLPETTRRAAKIIISLLNEHGFFDGDLSEVTKLAHVPERAARAALQTVQGLEPEGVGCRDVRECLLLQLRRREPADETALRLLSECFRLLGNHSPRQLARRLGVPEAAVCEALHTISALRPYPADGFAAETRVQYVYPDLFFIPEEGKILVRESAQRLPGIRANATYLNLLRSTQDPELRQYLKEKFAQLEQVLRDIQNRGTTVRRCAEIIAVRQADYFWGGNLKKLTLLDVAEEMGIHESTVSRAIRGKYIECPQGVFPMSRFFSRTVGQNGTMSREGIQKALARLLEEENTAQPMSDEQLSLRLSAQHIQISRRTVAKYRMELGIPSAFARKTGA